MADRPSRCVGETHVGRSIQLPQADGAQRHLGHRASLRGTGRRRERPRRSEFRKCLDPSRLWPWLPFSLALKSDKGGMLSAFLLLFGIMTIWLPPVRGALVMYPLGTISVLILLALIFKFAQAGGTFGFMTGGVLALYVIAVIVGDASQQPTTVTTSPPQSSPPSQLPVATQAPRPPPTPAPSP